VVVDSLKALDPNRPIREADISVPCRHFAFVPTADIEPRAFSDQRRAALIF
jgi:hypothetical protein